MFYLIVIALANVLIALANRLWIHPVSAPETMWMLFLWTVLSTVFVIAVDGVFAFVIRRLPGRWFAPASRLFYVGERERKLLRHLGVKHWKDKVPELGGFSGFHKDHLASAADSEYLARFLLESNYGVAIHFVNALTGFLILLLPVSRTLSIGLPVACVNFVLSILPMMILRYHTPPLRRLYARSLRNAAVPSQTVPADGTPET